MNNSNSKSIRPFQIQLRQTAFAVSTALMLSVLAACGSAPASTPARGLIEAAPTAEATSEATVAATETVAVKVTSEASTSSGRYLWPAALPANLKVDAGNSKVDANGFELKAADGDNKLTVAGGVNKFTVWQKIGDVTVRGQAGVSFDELDGRGVTWKENGLNYWVIGNMSVDDVIKFAESLKPMSQDDWTARLAEAK